MPEINTAAECAINGTVKHNCPCNDWLRLVSNEDVPVYTLNLSLWQKVRLVLELLFANIFLDLLRRFMIWHRVLVRRHVWRFARDACVLRNWSHASAICTRHANMAPAIAPRAKKSTPAVAPDRPREAPDSFWFTTWRTRNLHGTTRWSSSIKMNLFGKSCRISMFSNKTSQWRVLDRFRRRQSIAWMF